MEAEQLMARVDALLRGEAGAGQQQQGEGFGSGRSSAAGSRELAAAALQQANPYNRGAWKNLSEVLWPNWWLQNAVRKQR